MRTTIYMVTLKIWKKMNGIKNELVINVLMKLKDKWKPATSLITLIKNNCNSKILDKILKAVKQEISKIKDKTERNKLEKQISYVEKLRQKEREEEKNIQDELDDLLGGLNVI